MMMASWMISAACFHLEKKAVLAAVRAYRHASGTVQLIQRELRIKTL
jgi:hypothetical protein